MRRLADLFYRFRGEWALLFAGLLLFLPRRLDATPASLLCAALFLLGGGALRVQSRRVIGPHTRAGELDAPRLVRAGTYSRMRHPLYLANLLAGWGMVLLSGVAAPQALWLALGWAAVCAGLGAGEDRYLRERFGAEWERWAERTPFWGWGEGGEADPEARSALAAFLSDGWTWAWQAILAVALAAPWERPW